MVLYVIACKTVTKSSISVRPECVFFHFQCNNHVCLHRWLENVLDVQLPSLSEFERSLSNGVVLCKLGQKVLPSDPMWAKVYDKDESKFKVSAFVCIWFVAMLLIVDCAHVRGRWCEARVSVISVVCCVQARGLDYRHTDNINFFLSFMKRTGLPKVSLVHRVFDCLCTSEGSINTK